MSWLLLVLFIALAVLGPWLGADTRDGLSWRRGTPPTGGLRQNRR